MNTPPIFIATMESVKLRREQYDFQCSCLNEFIRAVRRIESSEVLRNTPIEWYNGPEKAHAYICRRQIELELERLELEDWERKFNLK